MFFEKYVRATLDKDSIINVNLDPALPRQRKDKAIPARFVSDDDEETLLNFSVEMIEQVSD